MVYDPVATIGSPNASGNPGITTAKSRRQLIQNDPRVTDWWIAQDSFRGSISDVVVAGTQITRMINRIEGRPDAIPVGTGPQLERAPAFNEKAAARFTNGVDRSLLIAGLTFTADPWWMALVVAKSKVESETFFGGIGGSQSQVTVRGLNSGNTPHREIFQFFLGGTGINIYSGAEGLSVSPKLVFICWTGNHLTGRIGLTGTPADPGVLTGTIPPAGTNFYIGKTGSGTPEYPGGAVGEIILGTGDIMHADNGDLARWISDHAAEHWRAQAA